jgi:hypothetical protein
MCISSVSRVIRCSGDSADCADGRTVRLAGVKNVSPGDYLEVYADLAIAKIAAVDARAVVTARSKKRKRTI